MGVWFTRFFQERQMNVHGFEKGEWEQKKHLEGDVIVVCVPLNESVRLLSLIASKVLPSQLVCDISSLKTEQMHALVSCQALGLHFLFGPTMARLDGQVILHTPTKNELAKKLLMLFEDATLQEISAQEHDKIMAFIQGFTHIHTLVFAQMLKQQSVSPKKALLYRTPTFHVLMSIAGRLTSQDPMLYASLLYGNPAMVGLLQDYTRVVHEMLGMQKQAFLHLFSDLSSHFKEYSSQAIGETERAFMSYALAEQLHTPIVVRPLAPVATSSQGSTFEWCKNIPGLQVTYYTRKKGTRFACHAHTGKDISKNPERFLLLTGKVRIDWKTKEGEGTLEVEHVSEVLVAPDVYHEFFALEDCSFLEYRRTVFDPQVADSLSKEAYDLYMNNKS